MFQYHGLVKGVIDQVFELSETFNSLGVISAIQLGHGNFLKN